MELTNKDDVYLILSSLPNIEVLNDKKTREEIIINCKEIDINDEEVEGVSLNKDVNTYNLILKELQLIKNFNSDIKNQFQKILKNEIDKINSEIEIPNYLYATNILKAKSLVYNFLNEEIVKFLNSNNNINKDDMNKLNKSLKLIQEKNFQIQKDLINIIYNLNPKIQEQTQNYLNSYSNFEKEINNLKEINNQKENMNKILYDNNLKLKQEINELNKKFDNKEFTLQKSDSPQKQNLNKFLNKKEKNTNNEKNENKTNINNKNNITNYNTNNTNTNNNRQVKEKDFEPIFNFSNEEKDIISKKKNNNNITQIPIPKLKSYDQLKPSPITPHNLSKKQLIQVINEIYFSKIAYDKKCYENKLIKETLEQHMYTYLNNKYGLKNLTIDWATSIINGIKKYARSVSEVCLFAKILRNELEEESHLVYLKLKSTINELLIYCYQNKFPYKNEKVIENMVNKIKNSFINENDWRNLISYLFSNDSGEVYNKIYNFIILKNETDNKYKQENLRGINKLENENTIKKVTRGELKIQKKKENTLNILYDDFLNILLEIQIRLREKYLSNFIRIFHEIDEDNDGILNEEEFILLIKQFNLYSSETVNKKIDDLLEKIDPFNTNVITFSDIVSLLSEEQIEDGKTLALDKIAGEDNNELNNNIPQSTSNDP